MAAFVETWFALLFLMVLTVGAVFVTLWMLYSIQKYWRKMR
jgi:hypothetical protein